MVLLEIMYWKLLWMLYSIEANLYLVKRIQFSWLFSFFSFKKCLICIAKLWYLGWINPSPPWFFGRKSVVLAIGSLLENCYMCLNICDSIFCCMIFGIGKTLLRKVTLERIMVVGSIAFPLKDKCLLGNCCVCFSISWVQLFQLRVFVVFKSSVKIIPRILIMSFICMFWIFCQDWELLHPLGVRLCFWKYLRMILLFVLVFKFITSPFIMYSGRDRGQFCCTTVDSAKGSLKMCFCFLIKLMNVFEYPNLYISLYKKSLPTLPKPFSWSTDIIYDFIFFVELCVNISRTKKSLEKIVLPGIPQVCSLKIVRDRVALSLFEIILVNIL